MWVDESLKPLQQVVATLTKHREKSEEKDHFKFSFLAWGAIIWRQKILQTNKSQIKKY